MLNIITGLNEMKTLTKHISCKYLMEENVIQIIGGIIIKVDVSVKNIMHVKKNVLNPSKCSCKNGNKYNG